MSEHYMIIAAENGLDQAALNVGFSYADGKFHRKPLCEGIYTYILLGARLQSDGELTDSDVAAVQKIAKEHPRGETCLKQELVDAGIAESKRLYDAWKTRYDAQQREMKELYDKARKRLPEVKAANVAGAYRVWSGAVSDLLPTGMRTAPGKHPDHGKMVCDERLNTMRKPCNQYTKAEVSEELARHSPAPSTRRKKNIRFFYEYRIAGIPANSGADSKIQPRGRGNGTGENTTGTICISPALILVSDKGSMARKTGFLHNRGFNGVLSPDSCPDHVGKCFARNSSMACCHFGGMKEGAHFMFISVARN